MKTILAINAATAMCGTIRYRDKANMLRFSNDGTVFVQDHTHQYPNRRRILLFGLIQWPYQAWQ